MYKSVVQSDRGNPSAPDWLYAKQTPSLQFLMQNKPKFSRWF